jgi:hypothetical protein
VKELFTAEGIPPKFYNTALINGLGAEWTDYFPETLYQEIGRVWGVSPSPEVSEKINAYKVFSTTDLFKHDAAAFSHIVLAMNDSVCDPNVLTLVSPEDIVYALLVLDIDPDTYGFEREVITYIRACCENAGLLVYPVTLRFAQPKYDNPELKAAAKKIKPAPISGDDMVAVQSRKLYAVAAAVVERITSVNPVLIEKD